MPRTKHVNEKNTKQEILSAYEELLAELAPATPKDIAVQKDETNLLRIASQETVEKITADLSKLKFSFNQTITSFIEQLTAEADRLTMLRKAIAIAEKDLVERQKISITAGLLDRMIAAQKQKEEDFEKIMIDKRTAWEQEQAAYKESMTRERTREEEEYRYQKQLEKKRDTDVRENERLVDERKKAEEREIKETLMIELTELRKKVAATPSETEKSVKQAVSNAISQTQTDAGVKAQMIKQQTDAELNLVQVKIDMLESTIKTQTQEIALLKKQADDAMRQVKDIAVSVIENNKPETHTQPNQQTK